MTRNTYWTVFVLSLLAILFVSCGMNDESPMTALQLQSPYGTKWKLIYNGTNNRIRPDDTEAYTLVFKSDDTFTGRSSANDIFGKAVIDERRKTIDIVSVNGVKMAETNDGEDYLKRFSQVKHYEVTYRNEQLFLRLFYPDNKQYYLEYREVR